MKNIAITTRIIYDKYGSLIDSLDCKWIEFLSYIGFNPVIIPTGVDYEKYIQLLNIDGIVFSGGDDLFSISNNYLSNVMMTYSDGLNYFGKWYLQLWAESIGKSNKGITALHAIGTTDQHSQLQLYLILLNTLNPKMDKMI